MRDAKRWLVWRSVPNTDPGKKPRKVPFYVNGAARHGMTDTPEDVANLASFDAACAALATGRYTGLGFALGPDGTGNYWQGVDLDDLLGRPELNILADDGLPGYTECSPSGNGIHAIGYGRPFPALGSNQSGIEAYSAGRFFTVTASGAGINEPACLADFVERVLRPRHSVMPAPVSAQISEFVDQRTIAELRSALASMRADDRQLWVDNGQRLKKMGEPGRALWLEWSQMSEKFDPVDAARVWDSFTGDRTGYQAIFKEAAEKHHWLNPMSGAAATPSQAPAPVQDVLAALDAASVPFSLEELAASATPHPHAFMSADGRRGLFPEGEVSILAAPGREGKTSGVVAICKHYALGLPLADMSPAEVRSVLIFSAEDDRQQYSRKVEAQRLYLEPADAERLRMNILVPELHSGALAAFREIVKSDGKRLARGDVVEPLIAHINALKARECPLGLVIFETASTISEAEEDNPGLRFLIVTLKHIAKATGVAVVLTHHTNQESGDALANLELHEKAIRGGTALVNNARQTHLVVNLGSSANPFPDGDSRTLLRHLVAPGETERVTAMVCLSSSKSADPAPLFMRWSDTEHHGPRLLAIQPPREVVGKSWLSVRKMLSGAREAAKADKKAEQGQANVRLVVDAACALASAGEQPTAAKISAKCGRSPTWAKPYLAMAVELGDLVRSTEEVPRTRGFTDVYRPPSDALKPWEKVDSTNDSTVSNSAPWSAK
ncbi:AAA family ATPase [Luteibacter yeojuensis]|uniref:AAA family ATPase n=1 Tax=Luteibacter yeojuensis TaxID=345309 RepID=A0A7X5QS45_9GAMM|nr:AAA family ATPase [Luteibacter yeojuensis]NID14355.1 AAA family ATPase [Luteibacter yeojuensis]